KLPVGRVRLRRPALAVPSRPPARELRRPPRADHSRPRFPVPQLAPARPRPRPRLPAALLPRPCRRPPRRDPRRRAGVRRRFRHRTARAPPRSWPEDLLPRGRLLPRDGRPRRDRSPPLGDQLALRERQGRIVLRQLRRRRQAAAQDRRDETVAVAHWIPTR